MGPICGVVSPTRAVAPVILGAIVCSWLAGCGGVRAKVPWASTRPTCLVLSVGAMKGLAHIGAIEALEDAQVEIQCVAGNSMGALVGSLYAANPQVSIEQSFREFHRAYVEASQREGRSRAAAGGVVGLIVGLATGGSGVLLGAAGAAAGGLSTRRVDLGRLTRVLDEHFHSLNIEDATLRFVTFHQERDGSGLRRITSTRGNLAAAVGDSIANPFIFTHLDVRRQRAMDPGADRVSATPVQDTCDVFPDVGIIAVNVTGEPAFYNRQMRCPLLEIDIDLRDVNEAAMDPDSEEFRAVVRAGYLATCRALGGRDCEARLASRMQDAERSADRVAARPAHGRLSPRP